MDERSSTRLVLYEGPNDFIASLYQLVGASLILLYAGRSVTIVAAYLMYVQHIDYEAALDLIRNVRPNIQ